MTTLPTSAEWDNFFSALESARVNIVKPLVLSELPIPELESQLANDPEMKRLKLWHDDLANRRDTANRIAAETRFLESIEANRERWQRMVTEGRYSYRIATHHWFGEAYVAATGWCHLQGPYCEPDLLASIVPLTCRICGSCLTPGCECESPLGKDPQ